MAYELHLARMSPIDENEPNPIPLTDWKAAISEMKGVRLGSSAPYAATNPGTGEIISIAKRDGDAEVYFPGEQAWYPAFRWFEGSASLKASFKPGDLSNPIWVAATELASRLGAVIRGDDGECYNLQTGEIIRN